MCFGNEYEDARKVLFLLNRYAGKSVIRVDTYDKSTGCAKYVDDLCPKNALIIKICHSTIAHGYVKSIDTSETEAVSGVVKILTCFDVTDIQFPTAGHPWSADPAHPDVADRKLLNRHVRYYGDDIAASISSVPVKRPSSITVFVMLSGST